MELKNLSIKTKLIIIFMVIKVVPLIILGWLAWYQVVQLVEILDARSTEMVTATRGMIGQVGELAVTDSIKALDEKSRETIEHMTTDTAKAVAAFLYDRDRDILLLAQLPPSQETYQKVITLLTKPVTEHEEWVLDADGKNWVPALAPADSNLDVFTKVKDNERDWHYRKPEAKGRPVDQPLYLEITFIDLQGNEKIKVTSSDLLPNRLTNVADKSNTWCKAETYFEQLAGLKPGEIYVSDVIGPYVGSPIIGTYTPEEAKKAGIEFSPETAAYAGKENPVGIKFRGLIRWATPVVQNGNVIGYLTMALDHRHLAEYTNFILPTEERYLTIPDAGSGNYAFIWDYKGRSIVHPRHHSIVGYDPATGDPAVPWLEEAIYRQWQESGLPLTQFLETAPTFLEPSQKKQPAGELTKAGFVGLDGRYLNFAPQCTGWHELTQHGGSGSFLIYWSGLWKITTAATIPYYTGQYGNHPRGFGYVTIGANVDEFHRAATDTEKRIETLLQNYTKNIDDLQNTNRQIALGTMKKVLSNLSFSTLVMVFIVILVAIWMATFLTSRIKTIINGIRAFQRGDLDARLKIAADDEMGDLGKSFNAMAESLKNSLTQLQEARDKATEVNLALEKMVTDRTRDLEETNIRLVQEIEERKKAEEAIKHLAYHDPLTGLPNRAFFNDRLAEKLERIAHGTLKGFALLLLDLDGFKEVNDTFGHEVGDLTLREVARRIKTAVGEHDVVSRLGGDEFTVLVADAHTPAELGALTRKINDALAPAMKISGCEFSIGVSIGTSLCPTDGSDQNTLIRKADQAMYKMKKGTG